MGGAAKANRLTWELRAAEPLALLGPLQQRDDWRRLRRVPLRLLRILVPDERKVLDVPGLECSLEDLERRPQDRALRLGVADVPVGPSERVLDRRDPCHAHSALERPDHVERDRGDATGLDHPRYQSDGPAAIRSDGREYDEIHLLALQGGNDLGCALLDQLRGIVSLIAHDRVMARGHAANHTV